MARINGSNWFIAASSGDITSLYSMIGTHKRLRNEIGETALMTAVRYGQSLVVQHLVPYEHSCVNNESFTALMIAVISDNKEAIEILCEYEHSVSTHTGQTALMLAIVMKNLYAIECLAPYSTGLRDNLGRTALMYAAFTGLSPAVQNLLPYEAGIVSKFGDTAFSIALERGHDQITSLLRPYESQYYNNMLPRLLNTELKKTTPERIIGSDDIFASVTAFPTPLPRTPFGPESISLQQSPIAVVPNHNSISLTPMLTDNTATSLLADALLDDSISARNLSSDSLSIRSTEIPAIIDADDMSIEEGLESISDSNSLPSNLSDTQTLPQFSSMGGSRLVIRPCIMRRCRKLRQEPSITLPHDLTFSAQTSYTLLMRAVITRNNEWFNALYPYESRLQDAEGRTALMHAACVNNIEATEALLKFEAGMIDKFGQAALHYAAQRGHTEIVRILINREHTIVDNTCTTPLMLAALAKHISVVQLLLEIQSRACDKDQMTALMHAAQKGHIEVARLLVTFESKMYNLDGETALMIAARCGFIEIVKLLLSTEAGSQNKDGMTALMFAAKHGHVDIVKLIVSSGIEMKMTNYAGQTALMLAAEYNRAEIASILARFELGIRTYDNMTALMIAATLGNAEVVRILAPAEAGLTDTEGHTALMRAAQNDRLSCAEILTNFSQEVNRLTDDCFNALHIAARSGSFSTMVLLAQIEPFLPNTFGQTPLMSAASNGHKEVVDFLLTCNMTGSRNILGRTALMCAAQLNHTTIIQRLAHYESGLQDTYGKTALIYSIESHSKEGASILLNESVICDIQGKTPLEYALENGLLDLTDAIIRHAMAPFAVLSPAGLRNIIYLLYTKITGYVYIFYKQLMASSANDKPDTQSAFEYTALYPSHLEIVTSTEVREASAMLDDLLDALMSLILGDFSLLNSDAPKSVVESDQIQGIQNYAINFDERLTDFIIGNEGICCVCMARPSSFIGVPCGHTLMCRSCMLAATSICPFCKAQMTTVVMIEANNSNTMSVLSISDGSQYLFEEEEGQIVYRLNEHSDDIFDE